MTVALTTLSKARELLASAHTVDEVRQIRDQAEAMRAYSKQRDESLECQNYCAEIKLRAERRLGELTASLERGKTGPKELGNTVLPNSEYKSALDDIGASKMDAHRWQAIASIPAEEFESFVAEVKSREEELTSASAYRLARQLNQGAELEANVTSIEAIEAKKLAGIYDVVVIDPPWPIQKIEREIRPNQMATLDYPVMEVDQISSFIEEELSPHMAEDCHVLMWTTHKFLPDALQIIEGSDLNYVCTFVWHKPGGFQPYGLPQYNCEFVLYARLGSPKFLRTDDFFCCFNAARGAHSEKPEDFYEVLRRVTGGRRLDVFNRRRIEGFDGWGKEAE